MIGFAVWFKAGEKYLQPPSSSDEENWNPEFGRVMLLSSTILGLGLQKLSCSNSVVSIVGALNRALEMYLFTSIVNLGEELPA